jgi:hypothetical protein
MHPGYPPGAAIGSAAAGSHTTAGGYVNTRTIAIIALIIAVIVLVILLA